MTRFIKTWLRDRDEGSITVLNIYFIIVLAIFAGVAIDMASLVQARTHLQTAADSAAHAAIVTREFNDIDTARAKAIEVAKANIPSDLGDTLDVLDINFGSYDKASKTFTVDNTARDAVLVVTDRLATNGNAVPAFLLRFVGFQNFDVRTSSVFETFKPTCLREGFVANDVVDVQSNNGFYNGFCIHSNTQVEVNNGNTCEAGVIISVPNYLDDYITPSSGSASNPGCQDAVRAGSFDIKILRRLDLIKAGVNDPKSEYYRDFLDDNTLHAVSLTANNNSIEFSDLATLAGLTAPAKSEGHAYELTCTKSNGKLTMGNAETWHDIVIITNCPIVFGNSVQLQDATIITTDESGDSWKAPNGLTIGKNDDCKAGGEVQLLSYGGVSSASGLNIYGSQIIVAKDVDFAANANGIEGASIIAGGTIDGTSNGSMAFCGTNMNGNFETEYFRLAG